MNDRGHPHPCLLFATDSNPNRTLVGQSRMGGLAVDRATEAGTLKQLLQLYACAGGIVGLRAIAKNVEEEQSSQHDGV